MPKHPVQIRWNIRQYRRHIKKICGHNAEVHTGFAIILLVFNCVLAITVHLNANVWASEDVRTAAKCPPHNILIYTPVVRRRVIWLHPAIAAVVSFLKFYYAEWKLFAEKVPIYSRRLQHRIQDNDHSVQIGARRLAIAG